MLRGWTRNCQHLTGRARAAVICAAGLATLGCAGSKIDLTVLSRPSAEKKAGLEDEQDDASVSVAQTGFEQLLRLRKDTEQPEVETEEPGRARVFSAFVDRLSGSREDVRDPFLEPNNGAAEASVGETQLAESGSASAQPGESETRSVASTPTRRPVTEPRSDAKLWRMFVNDAGTKVESGDSATTIDAESLADSMVPVWARNQAGSRWQDPSKSLSAAAFQKSSGEDVGLARVASAVEVTRETLGNEASDEFARMHVDSLMAQVRLQEQRGDLIAAYRTAVAAAEIAQEEQIVFAPRDEQPEDAMRRLTAQMRSAHQSDPFVDGPNADRGASPFGPSAVSNTAIATVPPSPAPVRNSEQSEAALPPAVVETGLSDQSPFDMSPPVHADFPTLHEWRGVTANRPVSLAVVDPTLDGPAARVHHRAARAALTESHSSPNLSGPLLAPIDDESRHQIPDRRQAMLAPVRSKGPAAFTTGESLRPSASKLALGSLPPAETSVDLSASASIPMATGQSALSARGGSIVWWGLGALWMVSAALFIRLRPEAGRQG